MEVSAVLLVTSVEKVTKSATTRNIPKSGRWETNESLEAISDARPVCDTAAAMLNPAPNRKMIS